MPPLTTISLNNQQLTHQPTSNQLPIYTIAQRDALLHDLELELNNRISRLRAHYQLAATALRTKLENRINRIPKKLWSMTLRQLNEVHEHAVSPIKKPTAIKRTTKLDTLNMPKLRKETPMKVRSSPASNQTPRTRTRAQINAKDQQISSTSTRRKPATASIIKKTSPVKRPVRSVRIKNNDV